VIAALSVQTRALLELTRPGKPIAAAMYALLGAYLAAPPEEAWVARALTAAAVVGLITAFGLVINDCCDVAVDSIGKPRRPIPSGRVSLRSAGMFAWTLAAAAVAISTLLGAGLALFAVAAVALSAAYSYRLKNTLILGNATVALLVAAVLVYGALTVGDVTASVWMAAAITFPYMLGQEALFNLEDEEEDRMAGLRTTATQLGTDATAAFVRAVFFGVMAVALTPWLLGSAPAAYLGTLAVCVFAPIAGMIYLLRRPLSRLAVAHAVKLSRLAWVTNFLPLGLLK
jgi:geranylgeranylglycerol-phosphate geranylgeranyltransferase